MPGVVRDDREIFGALAQQRAIRFSGIPQRPKPPIKNRRAILNSRDRRFGTRLRAYPLLVSFESVKIFGCTATAEVYCKTR